MNGEVNKQNCREKNGENLLCFREEHTQQLRKENVLSGIDGDKVIGAIFIDGSLDGEKSN